MASHVRPTAHTHSGGPSELLTRIADGVPIGIAAVDLDGVQSYVNQAFATLLGWPRETLIGAKPPFIYWPEDQLAQIQDAFQTTLAARAPHEGFSLVFQRRDGKRIDVLVHLGPMAA